MSIIENLVNKTKKSDRPLRILSFFYDGRFDIELLKTGHEFYGLLDHSTYAWPAIKNKSFKNLHILSAPEEYFTKSYDLILYNNRETQAQFFPLSHQIHLPGLIVDHDFVPESDYKTQLKIKSTPFPSVSTNEQCANKFKNECINYNLDDVTGEYYKDTDILICGNFNPKDYGTIINIKHSFPKTKIIGENQLNFSDSVDRYEDYKNAFKYANIYINLCNQHNLNYEMLWAIKYKCHIISNSQATYDNIKNVQYVESLPDIITAINNIRVNKPELPSISGNYSEQEFITSWNNKLESFRDKYFIL